jgi:hypothetical protein
VSIGKAQIQALRDMFIQKLGTKLDASGDQVDLPILEETLALYGKYFNDEVVANLYKTKSVSSGALAEPAIPQVVKFGTKYTLFVGYAPKSKQLEYYDFINKGVKGTDNKKADASSPYSFKTSKKSVPIEPIRAWVQKSNLKSISVKKYTKLGVELEQIKDSRSIAFVIARGIHKRGLKSTYYFDNAANRVFFQQQFRDDVATALGGDFILKIRQLTNGNNNNK